MSATEHVDVILEHSLTCWCNSWTTPKLAACRTQAAITHPNNNNNAHHYSPPQKLQRTVSRNIKQDGTLRYS